MEVSVDVDLGKHRRMGGCYPIHYPFDLAVMSMSNVNNQNPLRTLTMPYSISE